MPRLKQKLLKALENAKRVAVLGIGSELRGDDAVGLLVLEHLRKNISKQKKNRLSSINSNFNICDENDVFVGAEPLSRLREAHASVGEGRSAMRRQRSPHGPARNATHSVAGGDATPTRQNHEKKIIRSSLPIFKFFNGGTAPENLTGEIRRFKPGHLIMIDAVDMGKKPGTIALVDLKKTANTVFLTHKLPIKLMLDYLAAEMSFTTIFIGIQPRSLEFEGKISKPVMRAGDELGNLLARTLG